MLNKPISEIKFHPARMQTIETWPVSVTYDDLVLTSNVRVGKTGLKTYSVDFSWSSANENWNLLHELDRKELARTIVNEFRKRYA